MTKIKSINPFSGEVLKAYNSHSSSELESKLVSSSRAFSSWKQTEFSHRAKLMKNAANELRENSEKYARIISLEMGKVIKESRAEIEKCAWVCDFYSEKAEEFLREEPIDLPDQKRAKLVYQPLGTILAVMPWNFPFWQVFRFAAPTIMAGNTAILKHASNVPQCALAIEEIFTNAGFPNGIFQSVLIDSEATKTLIEDDRIKALTLTGSEKAGAAVASAAGNQIKKSVLELGGSDPFIVLKDADILKAAETAVKSRMINFGQSCIAAKRFIIEAPVYDQFLSLFCENLNKLKTGNQLDEDSDYCCMARPDLAIELFEQVERSVKAGAKVFMGGEKPAENNALFSPTVLIDIPSDAPAYSEEFFGPVALIFKVESEDEAIELANDSQFGLASSLWTRNETNAAKLAERIESGAVFINSMVASHPYLPFGGIKKSGYGRELGRNGILEFVNIKTVYLG